MHGGLSIETNSVGLLSFLLYHPRHRPYGQYWWSTLLYESSESGVTFRQKWQEFIFQPPWNLHNISVVDQLNQTVFRRKGFSWHISEEIQQKSYVQPILPG